MEFRFSDIVDPSTYNSSLCPGVSVRLHRHTELEEKGICKAQQDWQQHVGPLDFYRCTMGQWNYISCTLPECLPDRLELVSYANEISFMHDDAIDTANKPDVSSKSLKTYLAFPDSEAGCREKQR
jgi:hypothetical protein